MSPSILYLSIKCQIFIAPRAYLVQTIFYGSATKWNEPKILLCTKCGEIGKPDFSACKNVTDVKKTTNFNTGG